MNILKIIVGLVASACISSAFAVSNTASDAGFVYTTSSAMKRYVSEQGQKARTAQRMLHREAKKVEGRAKIRARSPKPFK